jgi:serine/threonine protein kinase
MILDNKYKIIKILGKGGFGEVFLAEEMISKRYVAIKRLKNKNVHSQHNIAHEIQHISKFQNPNIVGYYHHFYCNGLLHLVMEYCAGGSLRDKMHFKNLNEIDIIEWFKILCKTIRVIHKNKVYHRDIKPDNILFTTDGTIKIADFGIANMNNGTILYMSPEALEKDQNSPRLIDIYALGITFMECLIGINPFEQLSRSEVVKLKKQGLFPIQHLPQWQQQIINKSLDPNPHNRFQYIVEFEEALIAQSIPVEFNSNFFHISNLISLAEKEIKAKKWQKALGILETASQIEPRNLMLLQVFAKYYIATGDFKKAKDQIVKLLKLNPRIQFQKELAWINLEAAKYNTVIPLFSDHLVRQKDDLECFNLLIRAYYETNRLNDAVKLAKLLFENHPKIPCFLNNYMVCNFALTNRLPKELDAVKINEIHPIIAYNYRSIKQKSIENIISKLLFLDYHHNILHPNKLRVFNFDKNELDLITTSPIFKLERDHFQIHGIDIDAESNMNQGEFIIVNSRNDVWIYNLNANNSLLINDKLVGKKAFLIGVNKISCGSKEIWINSDGEKLL